MNRTYSPGILAVLSIAGLLSACNVFSPIDNPTSDAQLISAARAAMDNGDFATAQELYQRVSDNDQDIRNSESAFLTMSEHGATMMAFVEFVGNGANGQALTHFAERLSAGSGEAKRLAIHAAYLKHADIADPTLKAFVKFTTSLALAAELLAEAAGADGILQKSDLVADFSSCTVTPPTAGCDDPEGTPLNHDAGADIATTAPSGTYPNLDQLYYAINSAYGGLQALGANGKFGGTSNDFAAVIDALGGMPSDSVLIRRAFRAKLVASDGLNLGVN